MPTWDRCGAIMATLCSSCRGEKEKRNEMRGQGKHRGNKIVRSTCNVCIIIGIKRQATSVLSHTYDMGRRRSPAGRQSGVETKLDQHDKRK